MKKILLILSLITITLVSCKKESVVKPQDVGKTLVRIQEVDNDGAVQYSIIYSTYVKY